MNDNFGKSTFPPSILKSQLLTVSHGMFTRRNGASPAPFSSFNLGLHVGDVAANVLTNRQRVKKVLEIDTLVSAKQIHSDRVFCADAVYGDTEIAGYDALLTRNKGTGLLIQQADCQALLLHDPVRDVIAAIHCGWRGSVQNIIGKTIGSMISRYGSQPSSIRAVISPSLGPCCSEFVHFKQEFPQTLHAYQVRPNHFDFWKISEDQLLAAGMQLKNIETMGICTSCNRDFFSYRRMKQKGLHTTGRHGSAICIQKQPACQD